jgi:hypothetical protein
MFFLNDMIEFNTHFLFVTETKHGEEELEFGD